MRALLQSVWTTPLVRKTWACRCAANVPTPLALISTIALTTMLASMGAVAAA